jgi:hypothetical protein
VTEIQDSYVVNHIVREPELLLRQALSIPTVQRSCCLQSITIRFPVSEAVLVLEVELLFGLQPCEEPGKEEETKLASRATAASKDGRKGPTWVRACQPGRRHRRSQQLRPGRSHENTFRNSFCFQKVECV